MSRLFINSYSFTFTLWKCIWKTDNECGAKKGRSPFLHQQSDVKTLYVIDLLLNTILIEACIYIYIYI